MRRSSKEGPCQEETGWPLGKVIVVVVAVVDGVGFLAFLVCCRCVVAFRLAPS